MAGRRAACADHYSAAVMAQKLLDVVRELLVGPAARSRLIWLLAGWPWFCWTGEWGAGVPMELLIDRARSLAAG